MFNIKKVHHFIVVKNLSIQKYIVYALVKSFSRCNLFTFIKDIEEMRKRYERNVDQWNANMSILCNLEEVFEMRMPTSKDDLADDVDRHI